MSGKARLGTSETPSELSINAPSMVCCRRDLQITASRCKDPSVCGDFCTNAIATEWKAFGNDSGSRVWVKERRVERGHVIQQILHLLKRHFKIYLLSISPVMPPTSAKTVSPRSRSSVHAIFQESTCIKLFVHIARHVELLIYRAAFSKLEYANPATLVRRVQHFATIMSCNPRWKVKIVAKQDQASTISFNRASTSPRSLDEKKKRMWLFSSSRWGKPGRQHRQTVSKNQDGIQVNHGVLVNANERCYRSIVALTKAKECRLRIVSGNDDMAATAAAHGFQGSPMSTPSPTADPKSVSLPSPFVILFQGCHAPLLTQIFGFLDGVAVVRSFALNRYCYSVLPQAISDLRVSTSGLTKFLERVSLAKGQSTGVVLPNLQHLCVFAETNSSRSAAPKASTEDKKRKRQVVVPTTSIQPPTLTTHSIVASSCPPSRASTSALGETAIVKLTNVLQNNGCPQLRKLCMCSTFINSFSRNGIFHLTKALKTGCCPELEYLWLGGNALSDYGAMRICQLLEANACPKLSLLDLRSNGIGQDGVRYLGNAIAGLRNKCQLKQLCLGNNLITDAVLHELLPCFRSGGMQQLMFLGLDRNFLTQGCLDALAAQVVSGRCPSLRELCVGRNAGLTDEDISCAFRDIADSTEGSSWGLFRATTSSSTVSSGTSGNQRQSKRHRGGSF